MKFIETNNALKPTGHYSQAIVHNDIIYLSGQLAVNPVTGKKEFGSIEQETLCVLRNIELILNEAGSDINHVLKATLYIPDIALWNNVNEVYTNFFGNHKPARSIVPTNDLHFGFKIEIDIIAAIK
ncbi:MAG: RidA family protein [Clostridiales bacterium]|nr:RidA family protein [Clostridiales bacterium]